VTVVGSSGQPIECDGNQALLNQVLEELVECLIHELFRNEDLPEVALQDGILELRLDLGLWVVLLTLFLPSTD
jgi:hypothetical protein